MLDESVYAEEEGEVHITNEELSGIRLELYAVKSETNKNAFGVRVVLPESVQERIDFDKMASGEHPSGYYTMGQMMEVLVCHQTQLHPNCVEVENFTGEKHDVSDIGVKDMLDKIIESVTPDLEAQYKKEVEKGIVPKGLSFDDWVEFNANMGDDTKTH